MNTKLSAAASLAGPIIEQVKPHVEACNALADKMEAAGIGNHPTRGHVAALRHVAAAAFQAVCRTSTASMTISRMRGWRQGALPAPPPMRWPSPRVLPPRPCVCMPRGGNTRSLRRLSRRSVFTPAPRALARLRRRRVAHREP
jgi:hypothetical protein